MYVHDSNLQRFIAHRLSDSGLRAALPDFPGVDRRQEQRYSFRDRAWMHAVSPLSTNRRVVTLADLSSSGLRIDAVLPELPGSSVRVQFKDVFVIGEVRYCLEAGEGYQIGIRVDSALYALPGRESDVSLEERLLRRPA